MMTDQLIDPDETEDELALDDTDDKNNWDYGPDYSSNSGNTNGTNAGFDLETEQESGEDVRPAKKVKMTGKPSYLVLSSFLTRVAAPKVAANSKASTAKPKCVANARSTRKPITKAKGRSVKSVEDKDEGRKQEAESLDEEEQDEAASDSPKNFDFTPGYDDSLIPLSSLREIFGHLAQSLIDRGFNIFTRKSDGRPLRVGTFCSGTEAPILAMIFLKDGRLLVI